MQTANIMLALGGDSGTQVPKYEVTASEIAVLRLIHGADAVTDVEPLSEVERTSREEITRLSQIYGRAKVDDGSGTQIGAVNLLFPGAAARVFSTIDEIGLPDEFFKPTQRMSSKAAAHSQEPAEKPKAKTKAKTKAEKAAEAKAAKEAEAKADKDDASDAADEDGKADPADPGIFN